VTSTALRKDRRGIVALEFGLLVPVIVVVLLMMVEVGWQMTTEMALQHGAHDAARFAMTGQSSVPGLDGSPTCRAQAIVWLVTAEAPGILAPSNLSVMASADNGTSVNSSQSGFGGNATQTVVWVFTYNQPFLTRLGSWVLHETSMPHQVTMLVQNEPYSTPAC
jgi:Flp pilus assembly protein TadG